MKPFIGMVGTATAGVRCGGGGLFVFLVIGLCGFGTVGCGLEALDGAGADVLNGCTLKMFINNQTL